MFIVENYDSEAPLEISVKNNRAYLSASFDSISCVGKEMQTPVQYFCVPRLNKDGSLSTEDLVPARLVQMETVYEKTDLVEEDTSYDKLQKTFGTHSAKRAMAGRDRVDIDRSKSIRFNVENQILPQFNSQTTSIKEVYSFDLLFREGVVEEFENTELVMPCSLVQKYCSTHSIENRILVAIDCIYKTLSRPFFDVNRFPYPFFCEEVKDALFRKRLPQMEKDKLLVKLFILILMINDYRVRIEDLPTFDVLNNKVVALLKTIGCTVSSKGDVILNRMPTETYSIEK